MVQSDMFGFLSETSTPKVEKVTDASLIVQEIHIARRIKTTVGYRRDILDIIKIDERGGMSYERAIKIAKHKAGVLKNCMVVEKLERVVCTY